MRVPAFSNHLHGRETSPDSRHRKTTSEPLRQRCEIRNDVEPFLRTAAGKTETCDDLVEDEHRIMLRGEFAKKFQVAGLWEDTAGVEDCRLSDDCRRLVSAFGHHSRNTRRIIPGQHD